MTAISNALGIGATGADANGVSGNGEVSQLFTTLLVAQIKYQNPLEPQDPSQFVNQLTQLSQMEALQSLNKQGTANGAMLESLQVLALGSQVGSQVTATTDRITVGSEPISGRFTLADSSEDVALVIRGEYGEERRIAFGTRRAGDVPFTLDPRTLGLPAGTYSVHVEAGSGASPDVHIAGTLQTVRLSPQGVVLDVANIGTIASNAITSFDGRVPN